jgi:hypothetical protein
MWNVSKRNQELFTYIKGSAKCKWYGIILCLILEPRLINIPRFEIATESQGGNKGSADIQFYFNTTLVLKDPDPKLVERFVTTDGVKATKPTTADGGKTWFIERVEVPPMLPGAAWQPGMPAG